MNRLKNQILLAAGFAILAGVISGITAAPAIAAAIKAALVMNVDEPGRIPYKDIVSCSGITDRVCSGTGAAVPAGKRLVIQHVSAKIDVTTGAKIPFLDLTGSGGTLLLHAEFDGSTDTLDHFSANVDGPLYIEAGQKPRIHIQSTEGSVPIVNSYISGYLVDLTL